MVCLSSHTRRLAAKPGAYVVLIELLSVPSNINSRGKHSLAIFIIDETITGVQNVQVIHELKIALLELDLNCIFHAYKMNSIESLSLCFANRRDASCARNFAEASKVTPYEMKNNLSILCSIQERPSNE